jgi:hypothetical protein
MDAVQRHTAISIQFLANVLDANVFGLDCVVCAAGVRSCPDIASVGMVCALSTASEP